MRLKDVIEIIRREVQATGCVPPPYWTAAQLGIDRAGVSRHYAALLRAGVLQQPYGHGPWKLISKGEAGPTLRPMPQPDYFKLS